MPTPAHTRPVSLVKIVLAAVSVMLLTACAKPKAPEQLVFADLGNPIAALIYIAEAQGYFKDENLTVSYKKFTSGRDALDSVLAGEADVGAAGEIPFANNIVQGKSLRIIAAIHRTNQNEAVVARRDRGINKAADLAGKRIGVPPNTGADYLLSVLLAEAGLDDVAVTRVPLKPEQTPDALLQGSVDAVAAWSPYRAEVQAGFPADATIVLRTPAYTALSMLGVSSATLVNKREALQRLVNALVRAEDFVGTHNPEALQIVIDRLAIKQPDVLRQTWPTQQFGVRIDNVSLTALANEGAWLARRAKGDTAAPTVPDIQADIQARFAPELLEAIRPQSVTIAKTVGN